MMSNTKVLAICIFLALSSSARAAVISVSEKFPAAIYLNGEIKSGDLRTLKYAFDTIKDKRSLTLRLNSSGGSLEESILIGRWVRQQKIWTTLSQDYPAECFSSCVFVLAAGVVKILTPNQNVGIHRPYFTRMPNQSIEVAMKKALADSRAYFSEMNIPEQLADAMFSIPPEKIEILSQERISFYRLNQPDMVYQEELDIRNAAVFGMSRQEYMQKWSLFMAEMSACKKQDERSTTICIENASKKYGFHESQKKTSR